MCFCTNGLVEQLGNPLHPCFSRHNGASEQCTVHKKALRSVTDGRHRADSLERRAFLLRLLEAVVWLGFVQRLGLLRVVGVSFEPRIKVDLPWKEIVIQAADLNTARGAFLHDGGATALVYEIRMAVGALVPSSSQDPHGHCLSIFKHAGQPLVHARLWLEDESIEEAREAVLSGRQRSNSNMHEHAEQYDILGFALWSQL
mmetsp:Transcript_17631/g.28160  ORF Transcript_17631/g.28160 Transcript_17631/m.28160 type:complete len:201 (-) Transcript_17631:1369-1971(-)